MCGRYADELSLEDFEYLFGFNPEPYEFQARYNIAPTSNVRVVRQGENGRELTRLQWGLVPFWAKDPKIGNKMINARAETVAEKPAYRQAFKARRCLLPASGFFEWKRTGPRKTPYYIHPPPQPPGRGLALAGLWESNTQTGGETLETCTIITTTPNDVMAPIHDRMPVILAREDFERWLTTPENEADQVRELLRSCPNEWLVAEQVSPRVNNPRNDSPEVLLPDTPANFRLSAD